MKRVAWVIFGAWVASVSLAAGCRSFGDFCTEKMDCEGGNDADIEACEVGQFATADTADLYGCGGLFDEYWACAETEFECENDSYFIDGNACEDEARDYNGCISK
jgi:hypothetical protein